MSALWYPSPMPWERSNASKPRPEVARGIAMIGEAVLRRRTALRLSQRDVQRLSGMDQAMVSRLENGKLHNLRFARLARLVDALDGLDFGVRPTGHWTSLLDRRERLLKAEGSPPPPDPLVPDLPPSDM